MKETSGHNWACHANESVLCGGLATIVKRYRPDLDISVGHRISYETWYYQGEAAVIRQAKPQNRGKLAMTSTESVAEGLAILAEAMDHLEGTPDASSRQAILASVRSVLQSLAEMVEEPDALTWPRDPRWGSPFMSRHQSG